MSKNIIIIKVLLMKLFDWCNRCGNCSHSKFDKLVLLHQPIGFNQSLHCSVSTSSASNIIILCLLLHCLIVYGKLLKCVQSVIFSVIATMHQQNDNEQINNVEIVIRYLYAISHVPCTLTNRLKEAITFVLCAKKFKKYLTKCQHVLLLL